MEIQIVSILRVNKVDNATINSCASVLTFRNELDAHRCASRINDIKHKWSGQTIVKVYSNITNELYDNDDIEDPMKVLPDVKHYVDL